jgi:nucleotide-binding universal stress UspA family protein
MNTTQHTLADNRIVVGVDGSDSALAALRWAIDEAQLTNQQLEVVAVWQPSDAYDALTGVAIRSAQDMEAARRADIDTMLSVADPTGLRSSMNVEPRVRSGNAAEELLRASTGASMLVVGARGRDGFVGLLLGSVATAVTHHSSCPVVVVPAGYKAGAS